LTAGAPDKDTGAVKEVSCSKVQISFRTKENVCFPLNNLQDAKCVTSNSYFLKIHKYFIVKII